MKIVTVVGAVILGLLMGAAPAAPPPLTDADRQFIEGAHQLAQQEVAASRLARSKATTTHVQVFAKQMEEDHIAAHGRLEALAKRVGVTLSGKMDDAHADKVKTLGKVSGSEFDRQYVSDEITDHLVAIEAFGRASASANADIKALADQRLPELRRNLDNAQSTLSKL